MKRLINCILLFLVTTVSIHAVAENVSVNAAREVANAFIKTHAKSSPGSFRAPAMADILLTHTEKSDQVADANCYYIFNISGGGFIIISGDNRAIPVLAYNDNGQIDMNNLPAPLRDLLEIYKNAVDNLLTHQLTTPVSFNQSLTDPVIIVEPMTRTRWSSQEPFYNQTPMLNGNHSKVGCAGVAMSQISYFWQYPVVCDSLPSYWSSKLSAYVPALPSTTFDYSKMALSYCYWDLETGKLIQEVYTDEQAEEVAKLCRYCGQAIKMNYSPSSSGPTTSQVVGMKTLGFNPKLKTLSRSKYDAESWHSMIREELLAGRPVMYTAYGPTTSIGHVFILDGCNNEDYFHINMGWNGVADGWYLLDSVILTTPAGLYRHYVNNQSMLVGVEPPLFCSITAEVTGNSNLFLLGETITPQATDVYLSMSYRTLPFMFSLTDAQGEHVATSESITLDRLSFEQHSDITLPLSLPQTLPEGVYHLNLNYRTDDNEPLTVAATAPGLLTVVGRFAKYDHPFGIADVVEAIDYILHGTPSGVKVGIADVTKLIDYLLED